MKKIASLFLVIAFALSLAITSVSAEGTSVATRIGGRDYTTDANNKLAYSYRTYSAFHTGSGSAKSIDVISNYKTSQDAADNWIRTAYSNSGFRVSSATTGLDVTPSANFLFNGNYVQVVFTATAEEDVENGMIGIFYDVQIADNDSAELKAIRSNGRTIGFEMTDDHIDCSSKDAKLSIFFREMPGVTDVDTYWFGDYGDGSKSSFISMEDTSGTALYTSFYGQYYLKDENNNLIGYKGSDSSMNFTWRNINLQAGETKTFSIIIGVGNAKSEAPVITSVEKVDDNYIVNGTQAGDFEKINFGVYYKINNGETGGSTAPITWNGDNFTTTIPVDLTSLEPGTHSITFNAINNYGLISNNVSRPIIISDIEDPEVPTTPEVPETPDNPDAPEVPGTPSNTETPKDDVIIDDQEIPLAQNPKTNASRTGVAVCTAIVTMCGGIVLISSKRRKEENDK